MEQVQVGTLIQLRPAGQKGFQLLECPAFRFFAHPVQGGDAFPERGAQIFHQDHHLGLGFGRKVTLGIDLSDSVTQTLPTAGKESFNLVVLRSPELLNIIQGLGYSGARILVIDAEKRVRAETGTSLVVTASEANDDGAR